MRIFAPEFFNDLKCRIVLMPGAKDDFKFRIVLAEETFQIVFQHRFHAMQGLQYTDEREIRQRSRFTSQFSAEPSRCYEAQEQIDGAGEESQNRAGKKNPSHRGNSPPKLGGVDSRAKRAKTGWFPSEPPRLASLGPPPNLGGELWLVSKYFPPLAATTSMLEAPTNS